MNWIVVIFAGVSLFSVSTFLKIVIRKAADRYDWIRKTSLYFPYFEFSIWVGYYFWAIDRIFINKSYYSILLLSSVVILLVLFTWFYFKNILAGIVFKMQYQPKKGRQYTFEKYSGTIKEVRSAYLTLENEKGEELKVPYSHLFGPLFESAGQKTPDEGSIKLKVATRESKEVIVQRIRETILSSPWGTYRKEPVIKFISEDEDYYEFEIAVHLLSPGHLAKVEKVLREGFDSD